MVGGSNLIDMSPVLHSCRGCDPGRVNGSSISELLKDKGIESLAVDRTAKKVHISELDQVSNTIIHELDIKIQYINLKVLQNRC